MFLLFANVCLYWYGVSDLYAGLFIRADSVIEYNFLDEEMRLDIAENAKKNILWGTILKIYQLMVPFALRSVFIRRLGVEYVGLEGLFSSLLSFLNLAEMGIGSAVLFFLYQPVAEDDEKTFRQLLGFIKVIYRRVGLLILGFGLMFMPFLSQLVSGELPADINIYVIYVLNLLQTVLSYWLFPGKSLVPAAHQQNDMPDRISLSASTVRYTLQFIVLVWRPGYYIYLTVAILAQILENAFLTSAVNRKYPQYRLFLPAPDAVGKKVSQKVRGLLFHRIGGVIVNSADAVVITAFLGLSILGKYRNYFQIMEFVLGMVGLINSSWRAGIGNIIARKGAGAAYSSFEHSAFLTFCTSTVCCCCFLNLYQPFISLWVGEDMLIDDGVIVLLCVYFYTLMLMSTGNMFESAGGIWERDKYRPLMEGLINLGLNLVLVQFIGLYGILLSTILSMALFSMPWLYCNVVRNLFHKSSIGYFGTSLLYTASAVAICAVSYFLCGVLPQNCGLVKELLIKALISVIVPLALLYVFCHKREAWKWMMGHIFRLINFW